MEPFEIDRIKATLLHRLAQGGNAAQNVEAIVAAWQEIDAVLSPVIGRQGVAALYQRSLYVTVAAYPWLGASHERITDAIDYATLRSVLSEHSGPQVAAAGGALLEAFHELLASMVGRSLTGQLLHPIWEKLFSGSRTQDQSP